MNGETIVITRHGRAIARIVPETDRRRQEIARALCDIQELRKRTGKVSLPGAAMNTVIVTSSKLWMKAKAHPLTAPGSSSGSVTRRATVAADPPRETAACSMLRSIPVAAASVRRRAKGRTMTTWANNKPRKVLPSPTSEKKRRKAIPSTTWGIISGDSSRAASAARPAKS